MSPHAPLFRYLLYLNLIDIQEEPKTWRFPLRQPSLTNIRTIAGITKRVSKLESTVIGSCKIKRTRQRQPPLQTQAEDYAPNKRAGTKMQKWGNKGDSAKGKRVYLKLFVACGLIFVSLHRVWRLWFHERRGRIRFRVSDTAVQKVARQFPSYPRRGGYVAR
jgi:hypothetical protein